MPRAGWLAMLLIAAGCGGSTTHVYRVPSSAMEPTLHCAQAAIGCLAQEPDRIVTHTYGDSNPERGDIVVFQTPPPAGRLCGSGGLFVMRILGLPFERWREQAGTIFIDGGRLRESYLRDERRDSASFRGAEIPAGRYLLLGDNREHSCDSRIWGLVPRENIVGRVIEIRRGSERIHLR
jgi:signal peptidase I